MLLGLGGCSTASSEYYDVVIRGGTVYDGSGGPGRRADVGLRGDRIAAIGDLSGTRAGEVIDAGGRAVAPGFINMLSWSTETMIVDGRSQGEVRQGVTLQVFGEGDSMGPLTEDMKKLRIQAQGDLKYDIEWTTLAEYLKYMEKRGVSQNVASFIGASTIREHVVGLENKRATPEQMERMRELVRREMEAGALGIGSALIYAPGYYAPTEELIELCKVAAQYGGMYISHMRSEGNGLIEAVEELIRIAREAQIPAEIYHLKAAGKANWGKMDRVIGMVEAARREGLKITADMYTYEAASTGLEATMPPWVLEGGYEAAFKRLQNPHVRRRVAAEMRTPSDKWENNFLGVSSMEGIILIGFKSENLKPLTGHTLAEVARMRRTDPAETIMDLVVEDRSRVLAVYFLMSEENIRKQIGLPWMSFGSDGESQAPEGVFLKSSVHPRCYGNFARLLGKYVREEKLISLEEAVHRMTGLPAENLGLRDRGLLEEGMYADVVVFDPEQVGDRATFEQPHRYSVGVSHVFVNGVQVLRDGEHTGAKPGRAVKRGRGMNGN